MQAVEFTRTVELVGPKPVDHRSPPRIYAEEYINYSLFLEIS
jgi:hypothetical protein